MKPSEFEYHAPTSTEAAVALLGELGGGAKVLAGGQSLIPMLSLRLAAFDHQHGPADYRRHVGAAMVARAWMDAMTGATNG
jgi:CO/xanthine dehydrogenase FAD-binding subunit